MEIEGFDGGMLALTLVYFAGINAIGLVRAALYPRAKQVSAWMLGHGLDPDAPSHPTVKQYLRRTRWIRTIGFLAGYNVPLFWMLITRSAYRMNEVFEFWWVVGFGAGILVAELVRPVGHGSSAIVEPRRLGQYLPDFTRIDRWIIAAFAAVPLIASVVIPESVGEGATPRRGVEWYLSLALTAIAIVVVVRVVQEMILRRRQRADDLDTVRADDAMRSASIQGLAGLGYGAPMWITATMFWDLAITSQGSTAMVFAILGLGLGLGGFGMLVGFPRLDTKWTVPRARRA